MRIVSLVPSATELLFALGLGDDVAAVTHECDYPAAAQRIPRVTRGLIDPSRPAAEIDAAVGALSGEGRSLYALDEERIRALAPDLIVTQALCEVCAVAYEDVRALAARLDPPPRVIALDPTTLGEMLGDARTLANATGAIAAGVDLVARAGARIDAVRTAVAGARPVLCAALEWLDPLYAAGHWTPQLIEYAGGLDVLGHAGEHSERTTWEAVAEAAPDVVLVMPCGFDADRALAEAAAHREALAALGARRIVALDGNAYFSRSGPRLVDGLELLAHVLHPERVPAPPDGARVLDL
jgi:iron complex transport system substrate-binding protein